MNYLEKNIEIIAQNPNHLIHEVRDEDLKYHSVAVDGDVEFFLDNEERVYIIKDEPDSDNRPNSKIRELFFVIGINSVKEIVSLLNKGNPNSFFVILEPNPSFLLHAMNTRSLDFLSKGNVMLVAQPLDSLVSLLETLFTSKLIFIASNIRVYANYFYRTYDLKTYKNIVKMISTTLKYKLFTIGNSIEDSLIGLKQNLKNIHRLAHSKNVGKLKNSYSGKPAIIISAGPSLDKNIQQLKKAQGKAIMIAADTILNKLLNEGIIPDFVSTIERGEIVYKSFYQDKIIPEQVFLVAPPVVRPEIYDQMNGRYIIPLRDIVREYKWLNSFLQFDQDCFISMGSSCAHLAFGLASHLGASPIILVGQDLAYGEGGDRSHSSGTIYDDNDFNLYEVPKVEVDGYYGNKVLSNQTWVDFKTWFEIEILSKKLFVINATEGGARIENTIQLPLHEVIDQYCQEEINVIDTLSAYPDYSLNQKRINKLYRQEIDKLKGISQLATKLEKFLSEIIILPNASEKELQAILVQLKGTDELLQKVYENELLFHNLQSEIIHTFRKLYKLEETLSYSTIIKNLDIQLEFINVVRVVTDTVIEILESHYPLL